MEWRRFETYLWNDPRSLLILNRMRERSQTLVADERVFFGTLHPR